MPPSESSPETSPEALFTTLTSILRLPHPKNTPLRIEIIPAGVTIPVPLATPTPAPENHISGNKGNEDKQFQYAPLMYVSGPSDEEGNGQQAHLGIPKKALLSAFLAARRLFFHDIENIALREMISSMGCMGVEGEEVTKELWNRVEKLLDASFVLILWDCEHLTAVNFRRRVVGWVERGVQFQRQQQQNRQQQQGQPDTMVVADDNDAGGAHLDLNFAMLLRDLVGREVLLLEGLLTSNLNKHVKSVLLWGYRRWLVERFGEWEGVGGMGRVVPGQPEEKETVDDYATPLPIPLHRLSHEMRIIQKAGEVHPTNYYAWSYARLLTTHLFSPPKPNLSTPPPLPSYNAATLFTSLTTPHLNYTLTHPSDTSAWSYLLFLINFLLDSHRPSNPSYIKHQLEIYNSILTITAHILSVLRFYSENDPGKAGGYECIWGFVRVLLGRVAIVPERSLFLSQEEEVVGGVDVVLLKKKREELLGIMRDWGGGVDGNEGGDGGDRDKWAKRAVQWIERRERRNREEKGEVET